MPETRTLPLDPDLLVTLEEAGSGRPALVLHGGGGPATVAGIAAHLADTMHVLTPTHPGWNGTDRPERLGTIVDPAGAYLRLLDVEELRDVLLVGSSIGGWLAAEMAADDREHRISDLVLIDAVGVEIEREPIRDFFALDARGVAEYSSSLTSRNRLPPSKSSTHSSPRKTTPGEPNWHLHVLM